MANDRAAGGAGPERFEYDRESDLLDVYFEDERREWTVELTENVTVAVDRQRERVVALSFLDFSKLARPTTGGARSFPVTGLAELPIPERDLVLRLLTSPPVSRWLDVSRVEALPDSPFVVVHLEVAATELLEKLEAAA
jgi:uncharacterized protein YuzE